MLRRLEEQTQATHLVFEVWRLDDNGNEFLVDAFDDRESAGKKVAELAAGGHKQMYWIREAGASLR
jgi:hypothetical protein